MAIAEPKTCIGAPYTITKIDFKFPIPLTYKIPEVVVSFTATASCNTFT